MKRKLLVLAPANSIHTYHWVRSLAPDWDTEVLSVQSPSKELLTVPGVKITQLRRLTRTKLDYILALRQISKIVQDSKPDLIHAHYLSSYGFLAGMTAKRMPKILSIWGSDFTQRMKIPGVRSILKATLKQYDHVLTPSKAIRDGAIGLGLNENQVSDLQYGLQLDACSFKKSSAPGKILISPRGWAALYRIPDLILGFKDFLRSNPEAELWLCGSGSEEEKRAVREAVLNEQRVKVLGPLPQADLFERFSQAHVMVSISERDGRPQSVIEAIANGCRPVLSDLTANREIAGDFGIYVKEVSPESLAEAFTRAFSPWEPDRLFKKIREENDHRESISNLKRIYDQVLAKEQIASRESLAQEL